MKNFILSLTIFATATLFTANAQTRWTVDPVHSSVQFTIGHMVVSDVTGSFKKFTGTINAAQPDFVGAGVEFAIETNSLSTDDESRDKHIKGEDFLNVAKFPTMVFKGVSFKKVSDKNYALEGDLTIKGVTKRVIFNVMYKGVYNGMNGTQVAAFQAATTINREDYNITWNKMPGAVGSEIAIKLSLEFKGTAK